MGIKLEDYPLYYQARTFWEEVQEEQIKKGLQKYPEPLNPDSWTGKELVDHAMQESVDLVHYLMALRVKVRKLEEELDKSNQLRSEILWFGEQMELRLRENDHKGGWKEESREFLLQRLESNYHSLWAKMQSYGECFDTEGVIRKAANIANFAMMIADIAKTKGQSWEWNEHDRQERNGQSRFKKKYPMERGRKR